MRHFQWPRTVRFSRRAIVAWVVTGFFLPLSYLTWHILGWPADIRMAHDTTRLTSPLTDDGYIDFIRVIREDAQQATKVKDDPWFILFENERLQGRSPSHGVQRATSQWDQIVYRDPVAAFTNSLGEAGKWIDFVESIHLPDLRRRILQIVARLAMWRQIHSRFPDRLQSVQSVPGFAVASSALLVDPFSGDELVYKATNEGFALSTVGPNMQKEEGGVEECSIHEVDYRETRHPDDHNWRWPPAE